MKMVCNARKILNIGEKILKFDFLSLGFVNTGRLMLEKLLHAKKRVQHA
jgi:hypothetical protein